MTTNKTHCTLFTCSLFLHVGYIGIVTVAVGLIQLLAGEASVLSALALIVFGGLLAMASWRRARKSIELEHRVPAVAPHLQGTDLARPFAHQPTNRRASDTKLGERQEGALRPRAVMTSS